MTTRAASVLLSVIALAIVVPAHAASWPEWAGTPDDSYLRRFADADAVVLLDEWTIKLVDGKRSGRRRWVVHVLQEDGRDHASLTLASGAFGRYENVKFWVRHENGAVHKYSQDEGTLLGDARRRILDETEVLVLEPPGLAPGSQVAVEARFQREPDIPQDFFSIQQAIPVVHAEVTLERLGGWTVEPMLFRGANPEIETTAEKRSWVFRNLPGREGGKQSFAPEPPRTELVLNYVPPRDTSPFADWASTAQWGRQLFELPGDERPSLSRAFDELEQAGIDPVHAAGLLARKLRYFGIELGWGGYRPRDPETTLSRQFGDCKDKSQLMISLLRRFGIEGLPVLVMAPSDGYVSDELPSPFQFNHAVVAIPWEGRPREPGMTVLEVEDIGTVRIYDPTLADSSAQDIGYWLEGGAALVLDPRTRGLLRLPGSAAEENLVVTEQRWRLDENSTLTASETIRVQGVPRMMLEGDDDEIMTAKELRKDHFERLGELWPLLASLEVGEIEFLEDGSWTYELAFRAPQAVADFDEIRALELGDLRQLGSIKIPYDEDVPVYQPSLATYRKQTHIDIEGQRLVAQPDSFEVENSLGHVRVSVRAGEERVEIVRELSLTENEIPYDRREEALALRHALRRANGAVVLLSDGSR